MAVKKRYNDNKIVLDISQRKHLAEMLKDTANLTLAALVIGQFVEKDINWFVMSAGVATYFVLAYYTVILIKGGEENA